MRWRREAAGIINMAQVVWRLLAKRVAGLVTQLTSALINHHRPAQSVKTCSRTNRRNVNWKRVFACPHARTATERG
jgi:hypothetical protein